MRRLLIAAALLLVPALGSAQSSQFSARGVGLPGRALSARARALGGATGLFDAESSVNPASLKSVAALTASLNIAPEWRSVENPAGSGSLRDTQFPLILVAGPVRASRVSLGVSYANYADRDFTFASTDTIVLRDVPVGVSDTLSSRGGINDIRLAGAYQLSDNWAVGGGFHILTGSNRMRLVRAFEDPNYLSSGQSAELSFAGLGFSVGSVHRLGPRLTAAALIQSDGHLDVERDSTPAGRIDLPYTFAGGLLFRLNARLQLSGQATLRTWSGANSDVLANGGVGANNTVELAAGAEYTPDPRRPWRRPLRLGVRYAQLPFPLLANEDPKEFGLSLGTGTRFAAERAGIDLTLERTWRSEGNAYSEGAWLLTVGVSVRP